MSRQGGDVFVVKGSVAVACTKALLRYHDPAGWPMIREALLEMGKGHLIGNGPDCLVPPEGRGEAKAERSRNKGLKPALTRHSAITHQRGLGLATRTPAARRCSQCPAASKHGGKAGNGKPVGSQLPEGSGNGKSGSQGTGQGAGQVNLPANPPQGQSPDPCRLCQTGHKPATTQGGKPAAKGNGAKRPAQYIS